MRISDWSSDVCSSDLLRVVLDAVPDDNRLAADVRLVAPANGAVAGYTGVKKPLTFTLNGRGDWKAWTGKAAATLGGASLLDLDLARSEERRGGKECVCQCRSRWSPSH